LKGKKLIPTSNTATNLKLVVVGDKMVGKTSIISRYFEDKFSPDYNEKIWLHITNKVVKMSIDTNREILINFFVYDLGREETFEDYFRPFSEGANGVLIVFDLTRGNTYDSVDDWVQKLKAVTQEEVIRNSILIGNKSDLDDLREITYEEGIQKSDDFNLIQYIETSAKNNLGIREAFEILTKTIILTEE
jgi:small GTP-binding protein